MTSGKTNKRKDPLSEENKTTEGLKLSVCRKRDRIFTCYYSEKQNHPRACLKIHSGRMVFLFQCSIDKYRMSKGNQESRLNRREIKIKDGVRTTD